MENLIKALQIFLKYGNQEYPTNCIHDEMYVNIDSYIVSDIDKMLLDELGFMPTDEGGFISYKFGSY